MFYRLAAAVTAATAFLMPLPEEDQRMRIGQEILVETAEDAAKAAFSGRSEGAAAERARLPSLVQMDRNHMQMAQESCANENCATSADDY